MKTLATLKAGSFALSLLLAAGTAASAHGSGGTVGGIGGASHAGAVLSTPASRMSSPLTATGPASVQPGATAAKACPYDENYKNCPKMQSEKCLTNCRRVTPNGCDCFGCCAFQNNNTTVTVMLTSSDDRSTVVSAALRVASTVRCDGCAAQPEKSVPS